MFDEIFRTCLNAMLKNGESGGESAIKDILLEFGYIVSPVENDCEYTEGNTEDFKSESYPIVEGESDTSKKNGMHVIALQGKTTIHGYIDPKTCYMYVPAGFTIKPSCMSIPSYKDSFEYLLLNGALEKIDDKFYRSIRDVTFINSGTATAMIHGITHWYDDNENKVKISEVEVAKRRRNFASTCCKVKIDL